MEGTNQCLVAMVGYTGYLVIYGMSTFYGPIPFFPMSARLGAKSDGDVVDVPDGTR